MKTKEEIFRIKGRPVISFYESNFKLAESNSRLKLLQTHIAILNKDEAIELINWLIQKTDEM